MLSILWIFAVNIWCYLVLHKMNPWNLPLWCPKPFDVFFCPNVIEEESTKLSILDLCYLINRCPKRPLYLHCKCDHSSNAKSSL